MPKVKINIQRDFFPVLYSMSPECPKWLLKTICLKWSSPQEVRLYMPSKSEQITTIYVKNIKVMET